MPMNWFGFKKTGTASGGSGGVPPRSVDDPVATIQQLRQAITNLDKREDHVQGKIDTLLQDAKQKMSKGDKKGALYCMKRKKIHQQQIDNMTNVKMTLETQIISLESTLQMQDSMQALQAGSQTMKYMHKVHGGVEQVDNLMDDIREEIEHATEVQQALAQPLDDGLLLTDEDELLQELEELEANDVENELTAALSHQQLSNHDDDKVDLHLDLPTLPESANGVLPATTTTHQDEEDFQKLEAELAGL